MWLSTGEWSVNGLITAVSVVIVAWSSSGEWRPEIVGVQ